MASISACYELVATFTVEFDRQIYFRVEILRKESGTPVQVTELIAEVYHLRWPNGTMAMPSESGDTRFRQGWLFLEDFPQISGVSPEAVKEQVLATLSDYAGDYLSRYRTALKR